MNAGASASSSGVAQPPPQASGPEARGGNDAAREPLDLRLAPAAVAAWACAAVGVHLSLGLALGSGAALVVGAVGLWWLGGLRAGAWPRRPSDGWRTVAGLVLLVAAVALTVGGLRGTAHAAGPVAELADERAEVDVTLAIDSDPRLRPGQYGPFVLVRATVTSVEGRGVTSRVRSPVLVIAEPGWRGVSLGSTVVAEGRLDPSDGRDLAAVLLARGPPRVVEGPSTIERAIDGLRGSITDSVSWWGPAESALVPALVHGDDSRLPDDTVQDFRDVGMTHLLAVSGTNLTLVLWCALGVARVCGVRTYGLTVVGLVATVLFVLLARGEPSVLRAAAMGIVGLAGLTPDGRRRGIRALLIAVVALVLIDPWLATSAGFTLSVLATAAIVLLAPVWRDALRRWLPRGVAEAVAVPLAAQVVCTPVVAALSGQVSLVAVAANLLAAPAVGPATVLGLVGGCVGLVHAGAGHVIGWLAGLPAAWLVRVAEHGAALPGASLGWPAGPLPLVALTACCVVAIAVLPYALRMRWLCLVGTVALTAAIIQPVSLGTFPPRDWVLAVCDVGQGDALVLRAGEGAGVVVDAGPDPQAVDRCLDLLGIEHVPLVVLTHFHADHVDGLPGVLEGRRVDEVQVSPLPEPGDAAADVRAWTRDAGVPVTVGRMGERRLMGDVRWTIIGPVDAGPSGDATTDGEGSAPNNASLVLLAKVDGVRLLLTGDAEPEEEADILDLGLDLDVDVLKLAHHGSSNQDWDFVAATRPEVAVVSAGVDNTYGHPSAEALAAMRRLRAPVFRTDRGGTLVVARSVGGLRVVTAR